MERDRYILLMDGSTEVCSVALSSEKFGVIASVFEAEKSKQSERLAPMVHQVLSESGLNFHEDVKLSGVVVAEGPGSYTGLRIVAGYAKGLCMSLNLPLYTISTTELMVHTFLSRKGEVEQDAILMPMIDARRMEVYSALYQSDAEALTDIKALVLNDEEVQKSIEEALDGQKGYFFGSGAKKSIDLFRELYPEMEYYPDILPDVSALSKRGFELIKQGESRDVTYWEPFYLKEYQAKIGVPNKVLQRLDRKSKKSDD